MHNRSRKGRPNKRVRSPRTLGISRWNGCHRVCDPNRESILLGEMREEKVRIDPYDWEGDVTGENREQVVRALQERISTRHIIVSKHELFRAQDLVEGDYIVFTKESVAIVLVYGRKTKEYKMVVIE